jgi:hypothetical protein
LKSKNMVDSNSGQDYDLDIHPRWNNSVGNEGTDLLNFNIQPSGIYNIIFGFNSLGEESYFWSSSDFTVSNYKEVDNYEFIHVANGPQISPFLSGYCKIDSKKMTISTKDVNGESINDWLFSIKTGDYLKFKNSLSAERYYICIINNVFIGQDAYSFEYTITSGRSFTPFQTYFDGGNNIIFSKVNLIKEVKKHAVLLKNDTGEIYHTLNSLTYEYQYKDASSPSNGFLNIYSESNIIKINKTSLNSNNLDFFSFLLPNETIFKLENSNDNSLFLYGKIVSASDEGNFYEFTYIYIDISTVLTFNEDDFLDFTLIRTCDNNSSLPIRLIRDATNDELLLDDGSYCENYIANNNQKHKTVKIGNNVWLSENLYETKYNDNTNIEQLITSNDNYEFFDWNVSGSTYDYWVYDGLYAINDRVQYRGYEYELISTLTRQGREIPPNINSSWNNITPIIENKIRFVFENNYIGVIMCRPNNKEFLNSFKNENYLLINNSNDVFFYSKIISRIQYDGDYIFEIESPVYVGSFAANEEIVLFRLMFGLSYRLAYNNQNSYAKYPQNNLEKFDELKMNEFLNLDDVEFGVRVKELVKKHISLPEQRTNLINNRIE